DRRDAPRQVADDLAHAHRGGRADHRDEVVPAAVPEVCERVVLGQDRDARRLLLSSRVAAIGGLDALVPTRDMETVTVEELGEPKTRLPLLIRRLRLAVD